MKPLLDLLAYPEDQDFPDLQDKMELKVSLLFFLANHLQITTNGVLNLVLLVNKDLQGLEEL